MPEHERFDRELADAAREMQGERSSQQAMDAAVTIATKIISGCDMAGVSIIRRDGVDTPAISHLERAVGSRAVIGQATGIVMERYDLSADAAFGVLARLSSEQNVKLRLLAQQVVQTRTLPRSRRPAST